MLNHISFTGVTTHCITFLWEKKQNILLKQCLTSKIIFFVVKPKAAVNRLNKSLSRKPKKRSESRFHHRNNHVFIQWHQQFQIFFAFLDLGTTVVKTLLTRRHSGVALQTLHEIPPRIFLRTVSCAHRKSLFASQQITGQPQCTASNQRWRVLVEHIVRQGQLANLLSEFAAVPARRARLPTWTPVDSSRCLPLELRGLHAVGVIVQEEGQGGRGEAEVETDQDETLQVTELFLGEGVATDGQELAYPRWAHVHLSG